MTYFTTHSAYIRRLLREKHKLSLSLIFFSYWFLFSPLTADAIPPEESQTYSPRPWTPPGELTPEEVEFVLEMINNAIHAGAANSSNGSNSVTTDLVSPSIVKQSEGILPIAPTKQGSSTPEVATVKALEQASPAPTTVAYQKKYKELQVLWKTKLNGKSSTSGYEVFFQQDSLPSGDGSIQKSSDDPYGVNALIPGEVNDSVEALSSGNLTSNAIQALMLRYLSDNPKIDIPVNNITAASAIISSDNSVKFDDNIIKAAVLDPALDAFAKKSRSMYASIIRLEGSGNGQYVIVTIDKHGKVSLIDPALAHKEYDQKLLDEIVSSLNSKRKATDLKFVAAEADSIVYTGLNGTDLDNTRSGLYAFAYWAAFMTADRLDAYQSVNGAATEETNVLDSYDSINLCAVYTKKVKTAPGIKKSTAFELDLRDWLRTQINFD